MHELIEQIPIADTHEHLIEESARLNSETPVFPNDISLFFIQYIESDLIVSGMSEDDFAFLKQLNGDPEKKWQLIKKYWPLIRSTGYGKVVLYSIEQLFNFEDLNDSNWWKIQEALQKLPARGYYRQILQKLCHIDHCQINALDVSLYRETEFPDFFLMDLCISGLSSDFDPDLAEKVIMKKVKTIDDCIGAIDQAFEKYGTKAVAIKNQSAYRRKLDYEDTSRSAADECLKYCISRNWDVLKGERKSLEDFLFNYSVKKAAQYDLPYKMHTGYHSGHGTMPLHHLRHNAGDMSRLCMMHPGTNFVFLHIAYPYHDEVIALAKHFPNAYIDMCWTWMISPQTAIQFIKEFLMAVPVNKLFTFGGDVSIVELVPGHLQLAKKGVIQAINELIAHSWISIKETEFIYQRILLENARTLFRSEEKLGRVAQ